MTVRESSYLIKIDKGKYGVIGINNMIPVPDKELINFDICKDKNKSVLISQFVFCKKHSREITRKANKVYVAIANPDTQKSQFSSCNFLKLKNKAIEYSSQTQTKTQTKQQAPILPNQIAGMGFTQNF